MLSRVTNSDINRGGRPLFLYKAVLDWGQQHHSKE
jgi:hypothetical protein